MGNLETKGQTAGKLVAPTQTATINYVAPAVVKDERTFFDNVKEFLDKEVIKGSKIKVWYLLVAVVAYVIYVEKFASRQQKKSLKFW